MRSATPTFAGYSKGDLVATAEVARAYFDGIDTPVKAFVVLPRAGRDPNEAMVAAQYEILTTRVILFDHR